jgi:hypothetical protein
MIEGCPNPNPNCKYYYRRPPGPLKYEQSHGCFADTDHIIPQRLARRAGATALEKNYIMKNPENQQQLCRWDHDIKGELENDFDLLQLLAQLTGKGQNEQSVPGQEVL